jgi:hypothetical protein
MKLNFISPEAESKKPIQEALPSTSQAAPLVYPGPPPSLGVGYTLPPISSLPIANPNIPLPAVVLPPHNGGSPALPQLSHVSGVVNGAPQPQNRPQYQPEGYQGPGSPMKQEYQARNGPDYGQSGHMSTPHQGPRLPWPMSPNGSAGPRSASASFNSAIHSTPAPIHQPTLHYTPIQPRSSSGSYQTPQHQRVQQPGLQGSSPGFSPVKQSPPRQVSNFIAEKQVLPPMALTPDARPQNYPLPVKKASPPAPQLPFPHASVSWGSNGRATNGSPLFPAGQAQPPVPSPQRRTPPPTQAAAEQSTQRMS